MHIKRLRRRPLELRVKGKTPEVMTHIDRDVFGKRVEENYGLSDTTEILGFFIHR
jgi:predicted alpha/beta-hydrolase family hydrolase